MLLDPDDLGRLPGGFELRSQCADDTRDLATHRIADVDRNKDPHWDLSRNRRSMGIPLEDRGIVQVSMNLTNYEKTPIFRVFDLVKREAERYGVSVLESEIVGLVPSAALQQCAEYYLQLEGFSGAQVLEQKLRTRREA